jgi:SAM-dependent methyltransferase
MGNPTRIDELSHKYIDFSSVPCFPTEIQAKLCDPEQCNNLDVLRFLLNNSEICRILFKNPADFEMLEMVYFGTSIRTGLNGDCVDDWLSNSLPGQALKNRLSAVSSHLATHLSQINNGSLHILDLGAGPGPYAFETLAQMNNEKVSLWDCVDLDRYALAIGELRAQDQNLQHMIQFRQANFMSKGSYPTKESQRANLGVLVGIC